MAAANGPPPEHLTYLRQAAGDAKRIGLFGLLRGAEARARAMPRIGESRLPSQNIVDLAQAPTLAFPPSTLDSVTVTESRARVEGFWLGLTGPMGPLPLHLTEFAWYERRYSKARPFGRFLDVLADRALQFFYRAWADANPAASADRPEDDRFGGYVAALTGAAAGARPDAAFPAKARLHYASVFASRRSPAAIQDALSDLLAVPVRLVEYMPRWRTIEPCDQSRLGGGFAQLGQDAVAGSRVSTASDAFRVVVTLNSHREYEDFLPGARRFQIAVEALDAFAPGHLEWDLELEIPETVARPAALNGRARLGWTSWMAPKGDGAARADTRLGGSARRIARAEKKRGAP